MSIRFLLFDADGVIQVPSPGWRPALERLAGDPAKADEFLADVFAAERPSTSGEVEFADGLVEVLARWKCDTPVQEVLDLWTMIDPHQANLELVRSFRSGGYHCSLTTNQQRHRASYIRSNLGYERCFDEMFISCELGVAKPSATYFETVVSRLGAEPGECLFIDDGPGNVEAAAAVGLVAAHYHLDAGTDALRSLVEGYLGQ